MRQAPPAAGDGVAAHVVSIQAESPLAADLGLLFDRHQAFCHADTPPESIHMLDRGALAADGVAFFVARIGGQPAAMGAIKPIGDGHAEIKSMHVMDEMRGQRLGERMLHHLIGAARAAGMTRLSLETGAQDSFAPARRLYAQAGFAECAPFADYRPDPMSCFMTLRLT